MKASCLRRPCAQSPPSIRVLSSRPRLLSSTIGRHRTVHTKIKSVYEYDAWDPTYENDFDSSEVDPFMSAFVTAQQSAGAVSLWMTRVVTDVCMTVLPAHMASKRASVENSTRGGLLLLSLLLLNRVLPFVLMLGSAALLMYVANQVFGLRFPDFTSNVRRSPGAPPRGRFGRVEEDDWDTRQLHSDQRHQHQPPQQREPRDEWPPSYPGPSATYYIPQSRAPKAAVRDADVVDVFF